MIVPFFSKRTFQLFCLLFQAFFIFGGQNEKTWVDMRIICFLSVFWNVFFNDDVGIYASDAE